jgi:hypothetical protein
MSKQIKIAFIIIVIATIVLSACRLTPTLVPDRLRRAGNPDEDWFPYFCEVFLWPYNKERLDHLFITMEQDGKTVQSIPNILYEFEGDWILVLRGDDQMLKQMAEEVYLDFVG